MSSNKTIVAFGDSLTFGYGVDEENKWTNILARALGCRVINSGICGNTSSEGLCRIEEDVLKYRPDYVIINFGMNDHFIKTDGSKEAKVSLKKFEQNLEEMIYLIKENKSVPILVTPNKIIGGHIGDGNGGGGASHYYRRHPYCLYENLGGANAQLRLYCDIIIELGQKHGVLTIDINKLCESEDLYFIIVNNTNCSEDDGVHINKHGAEFYAQHHIEALKSLI